MKTVFVTVGSTSFDALSRAVLDPSFQRELQSHDYTHLVLQHGRSGSNPITIPANRSSTGLTVVTFEYAPNLQDYMRTADLVISHAGAGSIIEALKAGKSLIVVANEELMDNHQLELAEQLSRDTYCLAATPSTLVEALQLSKTRKSKSLEESDGTILGKIMQEELAVLDQTESRCMMQ